MAPEAFLCPGCGANVTSLLEYVAHGVDPADACRDAYHEILAYTLSLGDLEFIHQLAVDAYAAQHARLNTKPMTTAFALVGLYLVSERGFSGRQVQRVHSLLASRSRKWPVFSPPGKQAHVTVLDVVDCPDRLKQEAIRAWSEAVWATFQAESMRVVGLLEGYLGS